MNLCVRWVIANCSVRERVLAMLRIASDGTGAGSLAHTKHLHATYSGSLPTP